MVIEFISDACYANLENWYTTYVYQVIVFLTPCVVILGLVYWLLAFFR